MKKKILVTGLLVSVLSIAGYAYGGNAQDQNTMMNQGNMGSNSAMQQQRGMMMNKQRIMFQRGMMGHHSRMMSMFKNLNLDENQRYKISIIRDEMKLDMKKLMGPDRRKEMLNFITVGGFDKAAFKKHMNEMHKKMLDIKANSMEKIFNTLTKEQIAQLKKNIAG
ncbi:MAG: Spy/CpxP family protein refolding chaperone [Sulfurospirillum sp.]